MSVVNTCLDCGYTLIIAPEILVEGGGGVRVLINNHMKHQSQILHDKPEITSFESIELVFTISSITNRLCYLSHAACEIQLNDYLEKLSCMNGNIVIVGEFNIDWLNTNGSERKQFCNILESFEFVQNICTMT